MIYGEPLQSSFESWVTRRWGDAIAKRLAGPVGEYFLFTLAAQVTTLPVVLYHFNRLSLSAILANPLILPAQPSVMILGGIALIAGMLTPTLGQALAWLAWPLAAYTLRMVELLARIPSGAISIGDFTPWMVVASYLLLFGATFGWRKLAPLREKIRPGLVFASLGLVTLVAWSAVLRRPDGRLHVTLLDQADGQAVVLTTAGGQRVLVGGAAGANQLGSDLGRLTGPLDRNLDALVLHSASADTLEGLPLLVERFPLEQAFWAVAPPDKRVAENLNQALADRSTSVSRMEEGSRLQLDGGVILQVLEVDEEYAALQLAYGNLCLIWPGSFSPEQLSRSNQRVEGCLLLVDDSVDMEAWTDQRPVQFIFFGAAPSSLPGALATDSHGQIEIISDGVGLWVETERAPKKE